MICTMHFLWRPVNYSLAEYSSTNSTIHFWYNNFCCFCNDISVKTEVLLCATYKKSKLMKTILATTTALALGLPLFRTWRLSKLNKWMLQIASFWEHGQNYHADQHNSSWQLHTSGIMNLSSPRTVPRDQPDQYRSVEGKLGENWLQTLIAKVATKHDSAITVKVNQFLFKVSLVLRYGERMVRRGCR